MLGKLDEHTEVDAALFAAAVRLLLGRLLKLEQLTGSAILRWGSSTRVVVLGL